MQSMQAILRNSRFRRDQRTLEEEEETWFDDEDEIEDGEAIIPMTDSLKSKLDSDFDYQIKTILESKKGMSTCWIYTYILHVP